MQIEIWSDVVCPWCYIGTRRLQTALADFPHADDVEVVYRSFQLDPGAPSEPTETVAESLGRKYGGGPAAGQQMIDRVEAVAAEEGLVFRLGQAQRVGTVDAHRLLHLALEDGPATQRALKEELLAGYFTRADNVADHDVLRAAAATVSLDAARVDEVLAGGAYADEVEADIRQAAAYGAQPADTFRQVLQRAWDDSHPTLQTVGGDADACGPDGCAV